MADQDRFDLKNHMIQSHRNAVEYCGFTTGHSFRTLALCDSPETATKLVKAVLAAEAALDVLDALKELVRCVEGGDETAGISMDDALIDAHDAIAKAEGRA